jgi:tetratricopeptide (TPR) repeat protein
LPEYTRQIDPSNPSRPVNGRLRILLGPTAGDEAPVAAAFGRAADVVTFAYSGEPDILLDPDTHTFRDLLAALPPGWTPDCCVALAACHNCVLPHLAEAPFPLVGIVGDWDRTGDKLSRIIEIYDRVYVGEEEAVPFLESIGARDVRVQSLLGCDPALFAPFRGIDKAHDVTFIGGLDPGLWTERGRLLERIARLPERLDVFIREGVTGNDYPRELAASRIVVNWPVRGEVNMRCCETLAAGALLLTPRNASAERAFRDRVDCVLYDGPEIESLIEHCLTHKDEREAVAAAGAARAPDFSYDARVRELLDSLTRDPVAAPRHPRLFAQRPLCDQANALAVAAMVTNGRAAMCERLSRDAAGLDPTDAEPYNNLGCALAARAERGGGDGRLFGEAASALEQALAIEPDYAAAAVNLALVQRARGIDEQADRWLRRAAELLADGTAPDARAFRGIVLSESSAFRLRWQGAGASHLTDAHGLNDERRRLLLWRTQAAYAESAGRLDEALAHLRAAAQIEPGDGDCRRRMGQILWKQGLLSDAAAAYEDAIARTPLMTHAWYELAVLYIQGSRLEQAAAHLEWAALAARRLPQLPPGPGAFEDLAEQCRAWGMASRERRAS